VRENVKKKNCTKERDENNGKGYPSPQN
jgi:hypothetical protein